MCLFYRVLVAAASKERFSIPDSFSQLPWNVQRTISRVVQTEYFRNLARTDDRMEAAFVKGKLTVLPTLKEMKMTAKEGEEEPEKDMQHRINTLVLGVLRGWLEGGCQVRFILKKNHREYCTKSRCF